MTFVTLFQTYNEYNVSIVTNKYRSNKEQKMNTKNYTPNLNLFAIGFGLLAVLIIVWLVSQYGFSTSHVDLSNMCTAIQQVAGGTC